jgi:hypothetical protein
MRLCERRTLVGWAKLAGEAINEAWLPRSFSMLGDPSANSAPNRPAVT